VIDDDVPFHMGIIHQALVHLESRIEGLRANVISAEDAGQEHAYREAGRIKQVISEFVDGHFKLKASVGDGSSLASATPTGACITTILCHLPKKSLGLT
jgi:hypothetical protein